LYNNFYDSKRIFDVRIFSAFAIYLPEYILMEYRKVFKQNTLNCFWGKE